MSWRWTFLSVLAVSLLSANLEAQDSKQAGKVDGFERAFRQLEKLIGESDPDKPKIVAWVIDESGSMAGVRKQLAERIRKLPEDSNEKKTSWLVAGFSGQLHQLTPRPLTSIAAVSRAVAKVASDPSGKENVFEAVVQTTRQLKKLAGTTGGKGIVVVVTDERGDDAEALEMAVTECKRSGVRVFCLGHAAPFGTERSFVRFQFEDGFIQEIPVDQGAETAMLTVVKTPMLGGIPIELGRLSSGFGPWALSRLCDATGGEYLIAPGETKTRFAADVMARYRPDYQPMKMVEREVKRSLTRASVVQAAMASRQHKSAEPALKFRAERAVILRTALTESQRSLAVNEYQCHQMLRLLETGAKQRDDETDSRWQASYDLAMGQTHAALARSTGLNFRIAKMKVEAPKTDGEFNTWEIYAVKEQKNASPLEKKLTAKAKEFLDHVVKEHEGTPFAHVARLELERGFGWGWRQIHVEYATPADQIKPRKRFLIIPDGKAEKRVPVRRPIPEKL